MKSNAPKISILIPAYNNEKHISEAIDSTLRQEYPLKEVIVCDDCSTDRTADIAKTYSEVRVLRNDFNMGIGKNLEKLMKEAKGRYVIYLCADDVFTHPKVVNDIVSIFDKNPAIGVIGRYFYFFMDGHPGAIGVCRDKNILTQSCCPSGMAFRKNDVIGCNKIFVEMPSIVAQYLPRYRWTMIEYDAIAARYCPGVNTGTKPSYYTESPTQNWIDLLGENYQDFPIFITLKNRAPKLLLKEIWLHLKMNWTCLLNAHFLFYSVTALLVPSFLLKKLSVFYRNRITRKNSKIIERGNND